MSAQKARGGKRKGRGTFVGCSPLTVDVQIKLKREKKYKEKKRPSYRSKCTALQFTGWLMQAKINACTPTSLQQRTDGTHGGLIIYRGNMAPMQICLKLRLFIELPAGSGGKIPSYLCQVTNCSLSLPHTHARTAG